MNSKHDSQDKFIEIPETADGSLVSFEDFIKELEEKEKDLQIVTSEIFVEIEGYEDEFATESDESKIADLNKIPSPQQEKPSAAPAAAAAAGIDHSKQIQLSREVAELRQQIRRLEKEREEMRDVISRRQNDFDNYRKRTERDRHETFRNLVGNLAGQMLPVIDNLNRALDSSDATSDEKSPEFQHFLDGIFMVNQQLNEVLSEMGIEPINSLGETFDPHLHEAAATETNGEVPPNTITKELIRGYRMGEKIIRHAVVKVSAGNGFGNTNTDSPAAAEIDLAPVETE